MLTLLTSGQILNTEPFQKICENADILYLVIQIPSSDVSFSTNKCLNEDLICAFISSTCFSPGFHPLFYSYLFGLLH